MLKINGKEIKKLTLPNGKEIIKITKSGKIIYEVIKTPTLTMDAQQSSDVLFSLFDKDGNGSYNRTDIETFFNTLDTNNDLSVSYDEFKNGFIFPNATYADVLLQIIDQNADGLLDGTDYDNFIAQADTDGNGSVNKAEHDSLWTTFLQGAIDNS